ncbi:Uncharacterized protein Fot_10146 [Forsythia ovata]|uniref:Uncharacterized protein n=1 Tax=Forsythia ovata TaxID=205694 RepID=A0ABD1WGE3_9LAMI
MGLLEDQVGSVRRVAQIRCDLHGRGTWLSGGVDQPELRGGRSHRSGGFLWWFLSFVPWWIFSSGFLVLCHGGLEETAKRRRDGGKRRRSQRRLLLAGNVGLAPLLAMGVVVA